MRAADEAEMAGCADADAAEKGADGGAIDGADDVVVDHIADGGAADVAEEVGQVLRLWRARAAEEGDVILEDAGDVGLESAVIRQRTELGGEAGQAVDQGVTNGHGEGGIGDV